MVKKEWELSSVMNLSLLLFFAYFSINYTNNYYNSKNYKWNLTESKFKKWNTRYLFRWKFLQVWREHWLVEKGMEWDRKNDSVFLP